MTIYLLIASALITTTTTTTTTNNSTTEQEERRRADVGSSVPDWASCSIVSQTHVRHTEDLAPSPSFYNRQNQN